MSVRKSSLALAIGACFAVSAAHAAPVSRQAAVPGPSELAQARDPHLLLLRAGVFDPLQAQVAFEAAALQTRDNRYALVQLAEGFDAKALEALGVTVVGFIPNRAYQVRLDGRTLAQLQSDPRVRWADAYQAGWKVDPAFWAAQADAPATDGSIEIDGFRGESAARIAEAMRKLFPGVQTLNIRETETAPRVRLGTQGLDASAIVERAATLDGVAWVAPYLTPRFMNDDSIGPMQGNSATGTPIFDRDLTGSGQIVAISDSGLDRNESWFTRYDNGSGVVNMITDQSATTPPAIGPLFPERKVIAYWVQPGAAAYDNSGHGTHVVGSVAGDRLTTSTPTDPAHDVNGDDGMAPNAQILFQDIGSSGGLSGLGNWQATMRQSLAGGAHISNNSWGSDSFGAYTGNDVDADTVTWELEDLLVVVAAGNDNAGVGGIGSPAVAKNVLSVAALNHGNSTVVASFSNWGPTDDTRIKPDIAAPGSAIVSAARDANDSAVEDAGTTATFSGTSMASPTIAGAAALMRQYFADGFYPRGTRTAADAMGPNAALMKAVLLNGTAPIGVWPNTQVGWGRLWLENNLYFNSPGDAKRMRYWERPHAAGVATGETHTYTLGAVGAGQDLRFTLVWLDPEGGLGAAVALVNNLDLEVTGPNGTDVYKGNAFTAGVSLPNTGSFDIRDTVEQISIVGPTAGTYTIRVRGLLVPGNGREGSTRQGYALVASGAFGVPDPAVSPAPTALSVSGNDTSGVAVAFTGSSPQGYQLYRAAGTCGTAAPQDFRMVQHGAASPLVDDRTQGGYNYAYKVRGVDADVEGSVSTCLDALSDDSCTLRPTFATDSVTRDFSNSSCSVSLAWSAAASRCPSAPTLQYRVLRDTSPLFTAATEAGLVSGTAFTDSAVTGGTPYYYKVVAIDGAGNESTPSDLVNATPVGPNGPTGVGTLDDVDDNTFMTMSPPWSISDAQASTGTFSYRNARPGVTYAPDTCAAITSPPFAVAPGGVLTYDARFNLEQSWDGVVVEISTNGGATWSDLAPTGGYPGTLSQTGNPPINACGYAASQGAFTGSSGGVFQAKSSNLAAFAGQTVQVRWRFTSDPGAEEEGFYLDNVVFPTNAPSDYLSRSSFEEGEAPTPVDCR